MSTPENSEISRDEAICRMYLQQQKTMLEVAEHFDLSRQRIQQILQKYGIQGNYHRSSSRSDSSPSDSPSRKEMVQALRKYYREYEKTPLRREWESFQGIPSKRISSYFDGWKRATVKAGLPPRKQTEYSRSECLEYLRETLNDNPDDPPTAEEWDQRGRGPTSETLARRFGSWNDALKAAGFEPKNEHTARVQYESGEMLQRLAEALKTEGPGLSMRD